MSRGVRVLHLINGEHYAGAERVQDLLAGKLGEFNYQVGFVCLKDGAFGDARQYKNTPMVQLAMRSTYDVSVAEKIAEYARQNNYRILHSHTPRAALIGALVSWKTGLPLVHHMHSPSTRDTEHAFRNWRNSLLEKLCLRRARRLIPVSASLETYLLERGTDPKKIRQVHNGVPIREALGNLDYSGTLVLGAAALFRSRKGTEVLLRAVAAIRESGRDVRLHAVGQFETAEYQKSVESLVAQLGLGGAVTWTGFTQDVFDEFAKMHVFVLPSLYGEGMPMVLLEAMSVGLPIISTRVEGIPELVREGQDGLLVEPGDEFQLAEAIEQFFEKENDLAQMGQLGRMRQQESFSDESMARLVACVYSELLPSDLEG